MPIQINVGNHVSYMAPLDQAVPFRHQWVTNWALQRAKHISATLPGADAYFRSLPFGCSLTQLLGDFTIWINYAPNLDGKVGATDKLSHSEIAIAEVAYRFGRWTVLGTLIHELAHCGGAPGGASKAAEDALLACGLGKRSERRTGVDDIGTPFDPGAEG